MEISKAEIASAAAAAAKNPSPGTLELRGAEILIKALQAENVKYIWGYPGGAVLHIYDAFYKQDTIQHVLVRHEQALCTRPTDMRAPPATWAWRWSHLAQASPMPLLASPRPTWTASPW